MLFAEKYELLEQIGEGAMGRVYRARHLLLGIDVAVKVLRPQYANDEIFRGRFLREARLPHAFVHKRSVTLRDFGIDEKGTPYLTMDLCAGVPLSKHIDPLHPLPPSRAVGIAIQISEVLHEAHQVGILHRDIKPDNVMLDDASGTDQIKVMDFGIAKIMEGDGFDASLTHGGAIGTPLYMSPEQASGEKMDGRSDMYSLGVVLFEMLSVHPPFAAKTVQALLMKHLTQPPPALPDGPNITPGLRTIVQRTLAKTAEERYPDVAQFREALLDYLASQDTPVAEAQAPALPSMRPRLKPGDIPLHDRGEDGRFTLSLAAEREAMERSGELPLSVSRIRLAGETLAPLAPLEARKLAANISPGQDSEPRASGLLSEDGAEPRPTRSDTQKVGDPSDPHMDGPKQPSDPGEPSPGTRPPDAPLEGETPARQGSRRGFGNNYEKMPTGKMERVLLPPLAQEDTEVHPRQARMDQQNLGSGSAATMALPHSVAADRPSHGASTQLQTEHQPTHAPTAPLDLDGISSHQEEGEAQPSEPAQGDVSPGPHPWHQEGKAPSPQIRRRMAVAKTEAISPQLAAAVALQAFHQGQETPPMEGSPLSTSTQSAGAEEGPGASAKELLPPARSTTSETQQQQRARLHEADPDMPEAKAARRRPLAALGRWLGYALLLLALSVSAMMAYLANGGQLPPTALLLLSSHPELMAMLQQLPGFDQVPAGSSDPTPSGDSSSHGQAQPDATQPLAEMARDGQKTSRTTPPRAHKRAATTARPVPNRNVLEVELEKVKKLVYTNIRSVVLTGPVPGHGLTARVQGQDVQVRSGRISTRLTLKEGPNQIQVIGSSSRGSTVREFTLVLDTHPPKVAIESPSDGKHVKRPMIEVHGSVSDDNLNTVTLNGAPVRMLSGHFTARHRLERGDNRLEITARDRAGNQVSTSVIVQFH